MLFYVSTIILDFWVFPICHSVQIALLRITYAVSLVPVKYRIDHTAVMGSFVWAVKQVYDIIMIIDIITISFYLTKIVL